jgi:hypothetical protein
MSDRTTGATDAQIEAAAIVASSYATHFDWSSDRDQEIFVDDLAEDMCKAIIPLDHPIIGPEVMAALLELWNEFNARDELVPPELVRHMETLEAFLGRPEVQP